MDKLDKTLIGSLLLAALFSSAVSDDWKASVTKNLDALVTSCVVVPCSFSHPGNPLPSSKLRGIWHISNRRDKVIYSEDKSKILDAYKDRTTILGQLVGAESQKFSFVEDCVDLKMQHSPPEIKLTQSRAAFEGKAFTATCSVRHTCPSFRPKLSWSRGNADQIFEKHEEISPGIWVMESVLTFVPEEKDDHSQLICTAVFHGRQTTTKTLHLYLKRAANYKNIIIPIVVLVVTAGVIGLVSGLIIKKYKKRIMELQSQEGSVWNRMSRFSRRFRSNAPPPSQTNRRMYRGDFAEEKP
ncbi:myelin-associated glycoprotein isoform X2 [Oryzias melastigma]|uniref:myelin-associated glycoprotein isoform X2 n=1 Tax=Oryzias melastigma TaxID=30732 RepID=UPI000CF815A9|nr:myelin-associated glycoprotein isoform X2 [Oryzias melastigma]